MKYVTLKNNGEEKIVMIGGVDYIIAKGENWLPKTICEFISTQVGGCEVVSTPVECDKKGNKIGSVAIPEPVNELAREPILEISLEKVAEEEPKIVESNGVVPTQEEKEKYKLELEEMSIEEVKKVLDFKQVHYDGRWGKDKLINLIMSNK